MSFLKCNYGKAGAGVCDKDLPKSGLRLLIDILISRFWKIISLNIVFILFSLPIITMPAAVSAHYKMLCILIDRRNVNVFKDYWVAFKDSFVKSLVYGLISAALLFIAYTSISYYLLHVDEIISAICLGFLVFASLIWIIMGMYIHVMISTVNLRFKEIINNGFRLVFIRFFRNLITVVIALGIGLLVVYYFPISLFVIVFLFFSFNGLIVCINSWPIIKKYIVSAE